MGASTDRGIMRADLQRMLDLAESCGWPKLPIPKRRAGPGPRPWRTFASLAKPEEVVHATRLLEEGIATGALGPTESLW